MSADSRRCPASQFFMEEEQSITTYDKVVQLLNEASLLKTDKQRIQNLKKVQELVVHKESNLLDNFLEEILAFQNDKSAEVRKMVVNFIEEVCKKDADMLPKLIPSLCIQLKSDMIAVVKKVILSMGQIYKIILRRLCEPKYDDEMIQTWTYVNGIKADIADMIDSENDGLRTHCVKFMEAVVIALSHRTAESQTPANQVKDFSLAMLPESHDVLRLRRLEEEGRVAFDALVKFQGSPHISSVNLMTCMTGMTNLAKQRPQFMARVVQSFEALHVNLPPTLSKSQVSSVRKSLKMQMLGLLRSPASYDFHPQITTLLTDLGASQMEVIKAMPKEDLSRKRKAEDSVLAAKKQKVEPDETPSQMDEDDDYGGMTPLVTLGGAPKGKAGKAGKAVDVEKQTAIDITSDDLVARLTPPNVADLVLLSMVVLPESMPAQFQSTYTPIAAAGTEAQIHHLARLLATQLTYAGLGKGISTLQLEALDKAEENNEEVEQEASPKHVIRTLVGGAVPQEFKKPDLPAVPPVTMVPSRKAMRAFKLSAVTKAMDKHTAENMAMRAMRRILASEVNASMSSAKEARVKILASLVSQFGGAFKDELQQFIFADLRNRADLALAWIYQEYANFQGYNNATTCVERPDITSYDDCLTRLLEGLLARPDQRDGLFSRLLLEAPSVTENAILVLRKYCQDETRIYLGMTTLKELILKRPCMKLDFLDVLLDFTSHEKIDVRNNAIRVTKTLHERSDLKDAIENYALYYLKFLLKPKPPVELFTPGKGRQSEDDSCWSEEWIKLCLYLCLGLLPVNHKLIHQLANVYTATMPDVKRTILRVLEVPVKGMGMDSPELLLLVENCPKGAETFITRVIHILTDKAAPSPDLVDRVRDLYHKRVSDVRFLIPVLNGLTKKQVVDALPKLIKLNPVVVKEVFNRLLGAYGVNRTYTSPLTPAELLIALHYIEPQKCDMKTIIKATNLCFAEKSIYSQEVLAVVMQYLMEQSPLPTLLMRTVLQSLAMYQPLIGFVMNIMQRLITKQVWKQKKVWEGFVRCCQRTCPQSFKVLLQLPAAQLRNAFDICADLRKPLLTHVQSFTPHQRAHIPKAIMTTLERDPQQEELQQAMAKRAEEERLAAHERQYQEKLEEERRLQQLRIQQKDKDEENKEELVDVKIEPGEPQSIQTVGSTESIQTVSKVECIQTIGRVESIQTIGRVESIQTIGRVESIQTIGKVESIQTIGRNQPIQSIGKVESIQPIGHVESIQTVIKVEPIQTIGRGEAIQTVGTVESSRSLTMVPQEENTEKSTEKKSAVP